MKLARNDLGTLCFLVSLLSIIVQKRDTNIGNVRAIILNMIIIFYKDKNNK
jgi:hypothetical protein